MFRILYITTEGEYSTFNLRIYFKLGAENLRVNSKSLSYGSDLVYSLIFCASGEVIKKSAKREKVLIF